MRKVRILIVDDSYEFSNSLYDFLSTDENFELVGIAEDGEEALELIKENSIDIVILDVVIPVIDGIAVLKQIRRTNKSIKVIMLTAVPSDIIAKDCMNIGASYFFSKPMCFSLIADKVREISKISTYEIQIQQHEKLVSEYLHEVGMPPHLSGYKFLRVAILKVIENHDWIHNVTKKLYPYIARVFQTSASKVERSMRHAIEVAWGRGNIEAIQNIFKYTINDNKGKPTNSEFITMMSDKIKLDELERKNENIYV